MKREGKRRSGKNAGTIYEADIENGENYTREYMITKELHREREKSCEGKAGLRTWRTFETNLEEGKGRIGEVVVGRGKR